MITFTTDSVRFKFRVAGILIHDDKVLIHRLVQDDFYAFPGGRVEMSEDTETTIVREMKEELNVTVSVIRLLWVAEHFFTYNQERYHELCFYYLIDCKDRNLLYQDDCFNFIEGSNTFEFKWVKIVEIADEVIYPTFIKSRLKELPLNIERIVEIE
ncbi:MAG: NUDIX hydrolase [Pseudomonadota bacterium]